MCKYIDSLAVQTTTTTTTKTGKDGKKTTVVSTTPGAPAIQEMPADNLSPGQPNAGVNETTPQSTSPAPPAIPGPEVPYRNPNRKSGEYPYRKSREIVENPVSPIDGSKHNFSYPSRSNNNMREGFDDPNDKRPSGTIDSLKKAAVGIHVSCTGKRSLAPLYTVLIACQRELVKR